MFITTNQTPRKHRLKKKVTASKTTDTNKKIATTKQISTDILNDSTRIGSFAYTAQKATEITLENDVLKLVFSTKGGYLKQAILKAYTNQLKEPLSLIKNNANFDIEFSTQDHRLLNTKDLVFQPEITTIGDEKNISFKLKTAPNHFLEYRYTLKKNDYMLDFSVRSKNLEGVFDTQKPLQMRWDLKGIRQEKSAKYENQNTALHYEKENGKYDDLSIGGKR